MKENHTIKNPLKKRSLQVAADFAHHSACNRHLHSDVFFHQ